MVSEGRGTVAVNGLSGACHGTARTVPASSGVLHHPTTYRVWSGGEYRAVRLQGLTGAYFSIILRSRQGDTFVDEQTERVLDHCGAGGSRTCFFCRTCTSP
ncbi:unnamed protein product, partial [Scytosiphon promiscuus]